MQKAYKRESVANSFEAWTVHSYAGDYNPLHSHGVRTSAGLSCILYLKVPEQIETIADPSEEGISLNQSSGKTFSQPATYLQKSNSINQNLHSSLETMGLVSQPYWMHLPLSYLVNHSGV